MNIQLIARIRDVLDRAQSRGWYAPAGTYDGTSGRPYKHLRCHVCGGAHNAKAHG